MKARQVDLAFEWMSAQLRRPHHCLDEVPSALAKLGYWSVGATTCASSEASAVRAAAMNLEQRDVLERHDAVARLNAAYQPRTKAHPRHPQNRGEKPYGVRLAHFLSAVRGGKE